MLCRRTPRRLPRWRLPVSWRFAVRQLVERHTNYRWRLRSAAFSAEFQWTFSHCFKSCFNSYRLDNTIRGLGQLTGHPDAGNFLAGLTNTAAVFSLGNQLGNLTNLAKYPRGGIGGPAGSPTTWQHGLALSCARHRVFRKPGGSAT